jgi:hypothetical protein
LTNTPQLRQTNRGTTPNCLFLVQSFEWYEVLPIV